MGPSAPLGSWASPSGLSLSLPSVCQFWTMGRVLDLGGAPSAPLLCLSPGVPLGLLEMCFIRFNCAVPYYIQNLIYDSRDPSTL
jgi:hypothetical protein